MEEALLFLEKKRISSQNNGTLATTATTATTNTLQDMQKISKACKTFAKALHEYCTLLSKNTHHNDVTVVQEELEELALPISATIKSNGAKSKSSSYSYSSTTAWLYNLCQTIPSPLGSTKLLASAILSACQEHEDEKLQNALFDTLGESERAMEALFEIAPKAMDIKMNCNENELIAIDKEVHGVNLGSTTDENRSGDVDDDFTTMMTNSSAASIIDPEQERLDVLRRKAMEAAQYAALTKAEADAIAGPSFNTGTTTTGAATTITHAISRTSDKEIMKNAKRAAKVAAKAMAAAKKAGAIVDDDEILARGYNMSTLAAEEVYGNMDPIGLHKMDAQEFQNFQSTLLPTGSRQYYEQKGLPSGTEREVCDGFEKVTIPAKVLKPEQKRSRIVISDVMSRTEANAFAGTTSLNPMQSTVFDAAFNTNENLLICAPTGAGKRIR